MRTGFQNKSYWMRAAKSFSALLAVLAVVTLTGCGEPGLPGLGEVTVSGGADQEYSLTRAPSGGVCNFGLDRYFVRLFVTKEDADLGEIVFGSDTILDLQDGAANVELLTNALVTITNVPSWLEVLHSDVPSDVAFNDPSSVVLTGNHNGIVTVSTGSDGVSFLMLRVPAGTLVPADGELSGPVQIQPILGNSGIQVDLSFVCGPNP